MKKSLITLGAAALVVVASLSVALAQKESKVVYMSADKAMFKQMPTGGGVSMAVIWGDPDTGAHGTYTKFPPGYVAPLHTHTSDISIVVIKGAYLYKDEAGERRVGPGDFLRVPGGHKHSSGGDKTEGALFYEEGSAKFDLVPAQ